MSALLSLLKSDPAAVDNLQISQILALCGDGVLRDGAASSIEFREYLQIAKSQNLFAYVESCISKSFEKSGQALQDIVNEMGRRLDYVVMNGLYQGKSNSVGNDGLWTDPNGHAIVVEVKTSDAYRINLDDVARYRDKLIVAKVISDKSSVLLVVGRDDTGDLEAQVRGSRHAWAFRIISVDALVQLVQLKERTESAAVAKMHELLIPFEYTRLDRIIAIAFTVAEDANTATEEDVVAVGSQGDIPRQQEHTPSEIIGAVRGKIVERLADLYVPLIKKSRALYWSADKTVRASITVSKQYPDGGYWYAYHDEWDSFLTQATTGLYVLGCVGRSEAYAIPVQWMQARMSQLNITEREGKKLMFERVCANLQKACGTMFQNATRTLWRFFILTSVGEQLTKL